MNIDWIPDHGQLIKRGITIPMEGSEDDAVAAVLDQLNSGSATPSDSEVRELVRDARAGQQRPHG